VRWKNAMLLLDDGKSCQVIAEFLHLDNDTIRGWHKNYRERGWGALAFDGWKGGQSRMTADQGATLCGCLNDRFCRSTI
jgi:transposase